MTIQIIRRQKKTPPIADLHPTLQRIFSHRGIASSKELENNFNHLLPFSTLKDINKAVKLLEEAIANNTAITIIGDFDADGATATTVALKGLKKLGAKKINFLVPNRFKLGYGLSPQIVEMAYEENKQNPGLLITVDNGICNIDGAQKAKELGFKLLITDHHLPGKELPPADAIVNPNQSNCQFASKNLAGVGVIFYVLLALRSHLRDNNHFEKNPEPNLAELLDLVALGTIADVVPLDHNNRILVHQGLERIRQDKTCPGIRALLQISKRNPHSLSAKDLGFTVAPRLNAAGRLEDMSIGINCLLSENFSEALHLAEHLNNLNQERKEIEQNMKDEALMLLSQFESAEQQHTLPHGLALHHPNWHQGVIGILAARIKEKFHRPTIAFAEADSNQLKGSCRSIPGLHIRDVLAHIAAEHPSLIDQFGGHAMAAGLSIQASNLEKFSQVFNETVKLHINEEDLQNKLHTDGPLVIEDFSFPFAQVIKSYPWGQAFPEPTFDGIFKVIQQRIVGETHLKLTLKVLTEKHQETHQTIDAIIFNIDPKQWNQPHSYIELIYTLDINEFNDRRSLQLIGKHIQPYQQTQAKSAA